MAIQLDNVVYQALPFKGVFAQHISQAMECQEMVIIEVDERTFWYIECCLKYELGVGYDYSSIFRFLFFANYKKNNSWYCSELADMALGLIYPNSVDEKLISPSEFYIKIKSFVDGINYTKPRPIYSTDYNYDTLGDMNFGAK
ncbi:MAG: hypothetical protein ACRC0A_05175 [Chitinophagaceae bacterium]